MGEDMIPNRLHFVFGMAPDFGGKPFSLVHFLSVRSAVALNRPQEAVLHYQYEPSGIWWEHARPLLTLNRIQAPERIMGKELYHVAHRADVVRLRALQESGGIYLDLDTISVQPLTPLLDHSFVIGEERRLPRAPRNWRQRLKRKLGWWKPLPDGPTGLCNAVLLSEPGSPFIRMWLESYRNFRSRGRDKYWNEHSVKVPERLAEKYPGSLTRLGPDVFHHPLYDMAGLQALFEERHQYPQALVHHLWESFSWEPYLSRITASDIRDRDTTYNCIARRFLPVDA